MKYTMHRSMGRCGIGLEGNNIIEAIESGFDKIAREGCIGNAAGYVLDDVEAQYNPSILGGQGGVEVTIRAHGQDLAHKPASKEPKIHKVWIHAKPADLPSSHKFELTKNL